MQSYSLEHLSDVTLTQCLASVVARTCGTTAELIAHIAEFDERKLYLAAGYPSMFEYCVHVLNFSEDSACKRIRAGRACRDFPLLFEAIAAGRLHLSAVVMLAPRLARENVEDLVTAATHRSKAQIEQLLAERFPRPELLAWEQAVPASNPASQGRVGSDAGLSAPGRMQNQSLTPPVTPIAPERYAIQVTVGAETREKLRYAQSLLSHCAGSSDVGEVLDRALDALITQLEKRKFGATDRPRPQRENTSADPRHIPAEVRRAVWERDGGQCTFTSAGGHRCSARERLEFDHIEPVARGGRSTEENLRLRCRAHNQLAAERAFGSDFMREKRRTAERDRAETRVTHARSENAAPARTRADEIVPWLRSLGCKAEASREAARQACEELPGAPIEVLLKRAISYFGRRPQCVNEGSVQRAS